MIDAKRLRRVPLGPHITLLFENRLTCWWQVQEMVRVEQLSDPAAIQHELDTYNPLLPGPSELSATLLVEIADPGERATWVGRLVGLHEHLWLDIDGLARSAATFDREQFGEERISTVQFVRFPLAPAQRAAFADLGRPARIQSDHPAYPATATLPPTVRAALIEDMEERR